MKFDCPNCRQGIEVEARFIGKVANCPHCQNELTVPMISGSPPPVELVLAGEDESSAKWSGLPQKASETLVTALRILRRRGKEGSRWGRREKDPQVGSFSAFPEGASEDTPPRRT